MGTSRRRRRNTSLGQSGQTAVEYILLISVMVSIILALFGRIRAFLLSNQGDCVGAGANTSIVCIASRGLDTQNGFRFYTLIGK